MSQETNLTYTCYLGFDCKSMTGFTCLDCPNLYICTQSVQRHTPDYYTPRESIPYYIDLRNNALTVNRFLSPTTIEAGWSAALSLPYKYENNCLTVDSNRYYYESTEVTRNELIHFGWLPPELLPTELVDGYLLVVQDLPLAGWFQPDLLPFLKTEDGLFVQFDYNYDCRSAGWQCAVDLIHIYQLVICDNYCPECGCTKVMSVVFDDCEDYRGTARKIIPALISRSLLPSNNIKNRAGIIFCRQIGYYKSYHHCPNCLWSASIIPNWIEKQYFLEPEEINSILALPK